MRPADVLRIDPLRWVPVRSFGLWRIPLPGERDARARRYRRAAARRLLFGFGSGLLDPRDVHGRDRRSDLGAPRRLRVARPEASYFAWICQHSHGTLGSAPSRADRQQPAVLSRRLRARLGFSAAPDPNSAWWRCPSPGGGPAPRQSAGAERPFSQIVRLRRNVAQQAMSLSLRGRCWGSVLGPSTFGWWSGNLQRCPPRGSPALRPRVPRRLPPYAQIRQQRHRIRSIRRDRGRPDCARP